MYRIIDANINRICEGLRVVEEYLRFERDEKEISGKLKEIRHYIREKIAARIDFKLFAKRDADNDVGRKYSKIEANRQNFKDLLRANFLRVEEGLRVLEEYFKVIDGFDEDVVVIKGYRFEMYHIEKRVFMTVYNHLPDLHFYARLTISGFKSGELDKILRFLKEAGITCLEIIGKDIENGAFFTLAEKVKTFCRLHNIVFCVCNKIDMALLLDADVLTVNSRNVSADNAGRIFPHAIGYVSDEHAEKSTGISGRVNYIIIEDTAYLNLIPEEIEQIPVLLKTEVPAIFNKYEDEFGDRVVFFKMKGMENL